MGSREEKAVLTEQAVEQALDSAIDALIVLDSSLLSELAQIWGAWEITPLSMTVSPAERARLQAKLALLGRLLRQTEISLHLLGLPVGGYALMQPVRDSQFSPEAAYRGM